MPKNVFDAVAEEKGVFRNEAVLAPDFLPQELPGREMQEREIARLLKPAASGKPPANLFIHGPTGTGKTSACKKVSAQLKEYSDKPAVLYVNCWQNSTRQGILVALNEASGDTAPRRGVSGEEIFKRALQILKKAGKAPIVFLDEADKLFFNGEEKVLYDLTRSHEAYGVPIGVVLVSNDRELAAKADARIRSSLAATEIVFPAYSPQELKKIVAERAALALSPGAWNDEVVALCAAHAAKSGGDARVALQALYNAARNCQKRGGSVLSLQDARESFAATTSLQQKAERDEKELPEGASKALELLKKFRGAVPIGDFYLAFERESGWSERSARNFVQELAARKIVLLEEGRAGGVRVKSIRLSQR